MSTYSIKSSTLHRIASICNFFESTVSEELKTKINTVRLENKNGESFAVATNQKIASIEYLGKTDKSDGAAHLILSKNFLQQLLAESATDYIITVTTVPQIAISTLQSTSNFMLLDCCHWWDDNDTPLKNWRDWGCSSANINKGVMYWNLFYVESLIKSSPSGKVIFPEFINVEQPIVLRDYYYPEWVGLFIPQISKDIKINEGADLPEWWGM